MSVYVEISTGEGGFAEDKDLAKRLRIEQILPALEAGTEVVLDFSAVHFATQSYVHALIGEALKRFGESALDLLEFRHCSPSVRSVIELVVDYSLAGFAHQAVV